MPSLARAAFAACASPQRSLSAAGEALARAFGAQSCVLTDSGTSALVLALRAMVGEDATVALPGYGCVDLAAAVRFAGVRVRLYDVDPLTLSPDLDSVERVLRRGVNAVLVAHYYGYPSDVPGVRALAAAHGVPVLEDAAQAAGGTLARSRLGSLGDLAVLSFGRGKGLFGGHGGALLAFSKEWASRLDSLSSMPERRGLAELAAAVLQWSVGRPSLYAVPAAIPWLHLGEMVFHPAREPRALSAVAGSLVRDALAAEAHDVATRRRRAEVFRAAAQRDAPAIHAIRPIHGGEPGFLRFAVLDRSASRHAVRRLGLMRGYPSTLHEQRELWPHLIAGEPATPGATELRAALFTLPTHAYVSDEDLVSLCEWLQGTGTSG